MKGIILITFILCFTLVSTTSKTVHVGDIREFKIDYENNQFLLDGKPFLYVSGSLHYFRLPSVYWRDRLRKLRMAGLNAVSTYVEWSSHEKAPGLYDFSGELDIQRFIQIAAEEGLLVLLRPGPYICAERDMGGLPYWLLKENPNIQLRTNDATFMSYVQRWFTVLMTRLTPLLYGNGGPIIMVQVENEYGSYFACDFEYLAALREILASHVGDAAVLYTTDGNSAGYLKCGKINGAYATVDYGTNVNVESSFEAQRKYEPRGPLINSEFYPGWLDHWSETHNTVATASVIDTLEQMLQANSSVNFYMFFGGTNFGFTSGANMGGSEFQPQLTSYDYDAPLTEAGDPTVKYFAIRDTVLKYLPSPSGDLPMPSKKGNYGRVELQKVGSLLNLVDSQQLVKSKYPLSFEELGQWSGFVLYQTRVTKCFPDPSILNAPKLHDRASVYVNKQLVGTLSRMHNIYSLPILAVPGDEISLLVENQGRVNYGSQLKDFKGLLENATLNGEILKYWSMFKIPLDNHGFEIRRIDEIINENMRNVINENSPPPYIYYGDFVLPNNVTSNPAPDTFLDLAGWFKGVVFINGFNLGRYWSVAGPQRTLYLPGSLLKLAPLINRVVVIELERAPCNTDTSSCSVLMRPDPILNSRGCDVIPP